MEKFYFRKNGSYFDFASLECDFTKGEIGEAVMIIKGRPSTINKKDQEDYKILCDLIRAHYETIYKKLAEEAKIKMEPISSWTEFKELAPNELAQIEDAINNKQL